MNRRGTGTAPPVVIEMSEGREVPESHEMPLAGLSVLEISSLEAVQYAGRLLQVLGADVVKLEPKGGDPQRASEPILRDRFGTPRSLRFEFFNAGKSSAGRLAPPDMTSDRDGWLAFAKRFDLVIGDGASSGFLSQLGCADRDERQLLLLADIYGDPMSEAPARSSPLTRFHASTTGSIIPAEKDETSTPSWSGPNLFECMHGTGIAVAALAELRRPEGGMINYSIQAYGIWLDKMIFPRVAVNKTPMDRRSNAYPFGGNLLCSDGYVTIFVIEEKQWRGLCHLIGKEEWIQDPRFRDGVARVANQETIDQLLKKWCQEHSVSEVTVAARRFDVPCGVVRTIGDVVQRESFRERDFVSMRESAFGPVREMRLPFGPSFPQRSPGDAPPLDSHSSLLHEPASRMSGKASQKAKGCGPLEGLKVLDFTWAAAGPIVTSYMAWLGADVVKVEFRERPDLMRTANKQYGYPGDQDLNHSPSFNEIAAGKRSIELDLRQQPDRQLALRLADVADVLVENMRPGKIETLGLGYADVADRNPRIVMCSVSATGRSSEAINGYAPIFWAEGGGAWLTGWPSANPGVVRGPVDLHVAAMATLGTLALLWRRDEAGVGGYVDCSGIEAVANCIGAELLECDVTKSPVERSGNDQAGTIVNGLFPTSDAGYVAITLYRRDELTNLFKVLEIQSSMDSDEGLHEAIADATQARTALEVERALVEAGMACARMRSLNEALLDPALHEAGVFQRIEHERIGEQTIVGLPWRFNGEPYRMARPAPDLGADTSAILRNWLGKEDVPV